MESDTAVEYEFSLRFSRFSEMADFVADFEAWKTHKARKAERCLNDRRGQHTREYHARARIYKHENPGLTYRECMQRIKGSPATV